MANVSSICLAVLLGCYLFLISGSVLAQVVGDVRTRDSGRVRAFEFDAQEVVVTHRGGRAGAMVGGLATQLPGTRVVATKNSRTTLKLATAINRTLAAQGRDAVGQALPGVEIAPVLYEKGRPRNARFRRIVTREILAKVPAGWTAERLGTAVGAAKVRATDVADRVLLTLPNAFQALDALETLRGQGIEADLQLQAEVEKRFTPNDPFYPNQWHLRNSGQRNGIVGIDANVTRAHDFTKGAGVTLLVIDDSLQTTHPDLSPNCPSLASGKHYDFNDDDSNPAPDLFDAHGTAVAGVAAAKGNNGIGVSGAAPDAELLGIRLISGPFSDSESASALYWRPAGTVVGVSNNSWGPFDGSGISGPDILTKKALEDAARLGRGGRGLVTVFAAGNGKQDNDDSNFDGYANSRFVLAVAACTNQGQQSFYSEPGANILVCAPSNGGTLGIFTTDTTADGGYNPGAGEPADQNYTNSFGGTSSASPLTAGGVALLLSENPNLGWRDVHEILATTAQQIQPADSDWVNNGAGFKFSHKFGGGMIDLTAALIRAQDWQNLAPETSQTRTLANPNVPAAIPDNNTTGITRSFDFAAGPNLRVEHVELIADIQHSHRSDLEIAVTSPNGTRSVMAPNRPRPDTGFDDDVDYTDGGQGWSFTSTHHWGENSTGTWTLTIRDRTGGTSGTMRAATLKLFGAALATQQRVKFQTQRRNVSEAVGSTTVRVERVGSLQGAVSVGYVTSANGTATAAQDYSAVSGTLSFVDGQQFADITVPVLDDATPEGREVVYLLLKNPVGTALGGVSLAQLDVIDDDANFISVTAADSEAGEGTQPNLGIFRISRAAPENVPLAVRYTISGTATSGADYAAIQAQAVIPALESFVNVTITPADDALTEIAESIILTVSADPAYTLGLPDSAVVNIVDNDLQKVEITAPVGTVLESGAPVSFRVARNGAYPDPLIVELGVSGTARPTIHYEVLPERVEIPAGASFVDVPLVPIDDDVFTPNKFVVLELVVTKDYLPDTRRSARIVIAENEPLPDQRLPRVIIRQPAQRARISEGTVLVASGLASDNGSVERVLYRMNGGPWKLADGTTSWTADLTSDLVPGPNVLQARALDDFDNEAAIPTRTFTYVKLHTLGVTANTGGSVSNGFSPASTREAGQRYTITARPQPGFVFDGWSGDLSASARTFAFTMPDADTALVANFAANPFTSTVAGSYAGLVRGAAFSAATSGFLQIDVLGTGAFTGSLVYAGVRYPLLGEFTGSGIFRANLPRAGTPIPLALDLLLDFGAAQKITGTVSTPDFSSALVAERAAFQRVSNPYTPAVLAAVRYTLVFPPLAGLTSQQPRGNGWATLTIDSSGRIRWAGALADRTAVTGAAVLTKDFTWPLFLSLYRGKGVMLGDVLLDAQQSASDLSGTLDWSKPPQSRDTLFALGFTLNDTPLIGSIYTPPARGERVLTDFDSAPGNGGAASFSEGNLRQGNFNGEFTATFTLSTRNAVAITGLNPRSVRLTIAPTTGTFAGSFSHPLTGAFTRLNGVIFEKQQRADGTFTGSVFSGSGTVQTGIVTLRPATP